MAQRFATLMPMKRRLLLVLLLAVAVSGADKRKKQPKPPDLQVMEATAQRTEDRIVLDGRIRNSGEKPVMGLVLLFDFLAPGRSVITTQKSSVEEETLEPGSDAVFRVQLNDPVRAVEFQLSAVDKDGRDLRVANAGPFPIE